MVNKAEYNIFRNFSVYVFVYYEKNGILYPCLNQSFALNFQIKISFKSNYCKREVTLKFGFKLSLKLL